MVRGGNIDYFDESFEHLKPIDKKSPIHFIYGLSLGYILKIIFGYTDLTFILIVFLTVLIEYSFHMAVFGFSIITFSGETSSHKNVRNDLLLAYIGTFISYFLIPIF